MRLIDPRANFVKDYHNLEVVVINPKLSKRVNSVVLIEQGNVEYRIGNITIPIKEKIINISGGCNRYLWSPNRAQALKVDKSSL